MPEIGPLYQVVQRKAWSSLKPMPPSVLLRVAASPQYFAASAHLMLATTNEVMLPFHIYNDETEAKHINIICGTSGRAVTFHNLVETF